MAPGRSVNVQQPISQSINQSKSTTRARPRISHKNPPPVTVTALQQHSPLAAEQAQHRAAQHRTAEYTVVPLTNMPICIQLNVSPIDVRLLESQGSSSVGCLAESIANQQLTYGAVQCGNSTAYKCRGIFRSRIRVRTSCLCAVAAGGLLRR